MSNHYKISVLLATSLLIFVTISESKTCKHYTVVGQKIIKPNSIYNASISFGRDTCISDSDSKISNTSSAAIEFSEVIPSRFLLNINCSNQTYTKIDNILPGNTKIFSIPIQNIPEIKADNQDECELSILAENVKDTSKIKVIREEKLIILIQSDKPIYKPEETIRYRIVLLNRHFKPPSPNQKIKVSVFDSESNLIKNWINVEAKGGVFSSSLLLTSEPNLGDWKIQATEAAEDKKTNSEIIISVAKYVLPKIKVDLKLPPYVTTDSPIIIAEVNGAYTYGSPVSGNCSVRLTLDNQGYDEGGGLEKTINLLNGSALFEFNILKEFVGFYFDREYTVVAKITEGVTGVEYNTTGKFKIYKYDYKITEVVELVPRKFSFKITKQDDTQIFEKKSELVKIVYSYSFWNNSYQSVKYNYIQVVPSNGLITLDLNNSTLGGITTRRDGQHFSITYKKLTADFYPADRIDDNSYRTTQDLKASILTKDIKFNETIKVHVRSRNPLNSLHYCILSRGEISIFESFENLEKVFDFELQFILPKEKAGVEATFLVYTISNNGEVISDSVDINLKDIPLENYFNISLSDQKVEPGANVTLTFLSNPNSILAISAVDQSVLLLKDSNDINDKVVRKEYKKFDEAYKPQSSSTTFGKAGLVLLTNIENRNNNPVRKSGGNRHYAQFSGLSTTFRPQGLQESNEEDEETTYYTESDKAFSAGSALADSQQIEIRVRKHFPETWIWEDIPATGDLTTFTATVPDTLTSWIITGFALSPETGLGLNSIPHELKTFRPFFISLNLPYSVVKGEVFGLQVLVHSYLNGDNNVQVTFDNSNNDFKFVDNNDKNMSQITKTLNVKNGQVSSVNFIIAPIKFGILKLNLKAIANNGIGGDGVSQPLIVNPPGHKIIRNSAILLESNLTRIQTLNATFPRNRVIGADYVKLSVIGDVMGATVSNLDSLIQIPTGCGEQNMLHFVPDIVILDYLQAIGTLTPEIKSKAIGYLESGYQRQLSYRHRDGSFSAFGISDDSGSTWLTAFVIKSFAHASKYITIDKNVIQSGVDYLLSKQNKSEFMENGRVLNQELQSGAVGSALTSYVTLALTEVSQVYPDIKNITTNATKEAFEHILKSNLASSTPYALNLATYTFHLAGHKEKDKLFSLMEQKAQVNHGLKFWEESDENSGIVRKTKPISIEMTSYALMTYLLRGKLGDSVPIGRWLLQQRNPSGGFISTQDTVVGLRALSKFALATTSPNPNLNITATFDNLTQPFYVNLENAQVLQEFELPKGSNGIVDIKAQGNGSALVQLSWSYYIEKEENTTFDLTVEVQKDKLEGRMPLRICARYLEEENSNMAVMEVKLPSGYAFDAESIADIMSEKNVKRNELEDSDTKLNIYFDSFSNNFECVNVNAVRNFPIANLAKASVLVYDYYDITRQAIVFYEAPPLSVCEVCKNELNCKMDSC